jgi:hypothetical protein
MEPEGALLPVVNRGFLVSSRLNETLAPPSQQSCLNATAFK